MDSLDIVAFFNLCVIDISKLGDYIDIRECLESREAEYYLIISPDELNIFDLINIIPENYNVDRINKNFYIFFQRNRYMRPLIPKLRQVVLTKITNSTHGVIISISDLNVLYINLDCADDIEISNVYNVIDKLYIHRYKISIICLYSENKLSFNFHKWNYNQSRLDYCLDEEINFHFLLNNFSIERLNQFASVAHIGEFGNYGVTMYIPYIEPDILHDLEKCFKKEIFPT